MNGKKAKRMRRFVRVTYPFMSVEARYRTLPSGQVVLAEVCQRALYLVIKREYKKNKNRYKENNND